MSAYLKFFELETSPFDTSAQSKLVLGTRALRAAYKQIDDGLTEGAPRICLSGKAGMGKTSLARALPKLLGDGARVVVLLNPALPWLTLRTAIIRQLDLEGGTLSRRTLVARRSPQRRLVLVIDQAEKISKESLEHLDTLLNYRDDEEGQLVHAVLLANLEQASRDEASPLLWWLDSLTTLQLEFAPIPSKGIGTYIDKHLKRAGWKGDGLFTEEAVQTIHRLTGGVPRAVSELCEKLLTEAADREVQRIGPEIVEDVCGEERSGAGSGASKSEVPRTTHHDESAAEEEAARAAHAPADAIPEPEPTAEPQGRAAGSRPAGSAASDASNASLTGLDAYFGTPSPSRTEHGEPISEDTPSVDDLAERRFRPRRYVAAALLVIAIGGAAWLSLGGGEASEVAPAARVAKRPSAPPVPSSASPSSAVTNHDANDTGTQASAARLASEHADPAAPKASMPRPASRPSAGVAVGGFSNPVTTPIRMASAAETDTSTPPPASATPAPALMTSTSRGAATVVRPMPLLTSVSGKGAESPARDSAAKPAARTDNAAASKASSAPAAPAHDAGALPLEGDERHF